MPRHVLALASMVMLASPVVVGAQSSPSASSQPETFPIQLQTALERVPAGAAVIRVVHARTGAPLNARVSADGRFVTGRPPEGADYRVDVRRIDNADAAALPYILSLTLR